MDTKLKRVRIDSKTSQQELANAVKISVRTLIRYENGQQIPPLDVAYRIAAYYNKMVEDVFCVKDYSNT